MSEIIKPTRRGFITGLTSLIVAPAIVRVESLMPVKVNNKPLTMNEILYECIKLFKNSNSFIEQIDLQYANMFGQLFYESNLNKINVKLIPNEEIYVKAN